MDSDITMVPLERACGLIDRMRERFFNELPVEAVPIAYSLNRRLAADVKAAAISPRHNISTMDGYALNTNDEYPLAINGEVFAGHARENALGRGEAVYITTGAVVPEGANGVLRVEDALVEGTALKGVPLRPWENVILKGVDFSVGEVILKRGTAVSPGAICIMSAAAVDKVDVFRKINVGVLSTGDEIRGGSTVDCNAPMVCAMLETWGCVPEHVGVAPDSPMETRAMLDSAASKYDAVVTIGGVSVGKKDYVAATILDTGRVVFHGYRVRPGKPLLVSYYADRPIFSLPGKPTGAFTAMELIVKRFILGDRARPALCVPISRDVRFNGNDFDYAVYVQLKDGKAVPMGYVDSPLRLFSGPRYGVSIVSSSSRPMAADGFFLAREDLEAGQAVNVFLLA